ncbi:hypothetical protein [Selenomonas ruminantium]|uniref:hypothetical protein n=1 Tax=Selenomonas ruminantium TaxID=971 RepID=UPI0026F1EF3C|nr:hypothetical protein [Selenomonas ruminantium]
MIKAIIITITFIIFSFFVYKRVFRPEYKKRLRFTLFTFIVLSSSFLFFTVLFFAYFCNYYEQMDGMKKYTIPTTEFVDAVHNPINTVQVEGKFIYINKGTEKQEIYFLFKDNIIRVTDPSQVKEILKLYQPI